MGGYAVISRPSTCRGIDGGTEKATGAGAGQGIRERKMTPAGKSKNRSEGRPEPVGKPEPRHGKREGKRVGRGLASLCLKQAQRTGVKTTPKPRGKGPVPQVTEGLEGSELDS